jgi:adenylate kinase
MTETAHVTIQHIDTITRAQSENFIEELVLMECLTELATNIPERFIELIQMDTLSIINAQLEEIIGQRHIAPRRERRQFLEEQATDLEEMLEGVVPRRETEYYELDYEEYQDNEETRSRFVLVYHE